MGGAVFRSGVGVTNVIGALLALILALINVSNAYETAPTPKEPPADVWQTLEATEEPEWSVFTATAYTADCRGCTGITKSGLDVRHTQVDANGRRIIAVDPTVIPLGTALDIRIVNAEGSTEIIEAVAEDIGGDIKGARIDVLMATEKEARAFGRQDVKIRIKTEE